MALTVLINATTAIDGRCQRRSRCRRQFASEARRLRLSNINNSAIANVIVIENALQLINVNDGCQSVMH